MSTTAADASRKLVDIFRYTTSLLPALSKRTQGYYQGSKAGNGEMPSVYRPPIYRDSDISRWDLLVEMPLWRVTWIVSLEDTVQGP